MEFAELPNLAVRLQTHKVFLNQAAPLSGKSLFTVLILQILNKFKPGDVFAGSSIFQLCNAVKVTAFALLSQ